MVQLMQERLGNLWRWQKVVPELLVDGHDAI